jgi:TRAP-type C4-dicarboxylate transport system substrate-binding protein
MLLCAVFAASVLFAAAPVLSVKKAKYRIKIGSYVTPGSVWGKIVDKTIKSVKKRTGGDAEIVHQHSGQLGSSQNMLEQTLAGGIQGAGIPSSDLAGLVPEVHIIEMPFLFRDRAEAYYLLDNVIAPMLRPKFEAKGLKTSAFMESGFMDIVGPSGVRKPADLKKFKIGSWDSAVHVAFWKSLGARPKPIPATDVFRAYTSGQVNSGANNPNALLAWDSLFGTAINRKKIHITRIGFSYQSGVLVGNKAYWDKLPKDVRDVLDDEWGKLTSRIRTALTKAEPNSITALKKRGYQFHTLKASEKQAFIKKSKKVYKDMEKIVGRDFMNKVLDERGKYRKKNNKK